MAVTTDRYELPLAVCGSPDELGKCFGMSGNSVLVSLWRNETGKRRGAKFIRVKIEEGEEE